MAAVLRIYREALSGLPTDAWILTAAAVVNRAGTMVVPFLALWLTKSRGYSADAAGLLLGAYGVGSIAGSWLGGVLSDRLGAIRAQTASLCGSAAAFFVLSQAEGTAATIAAILLASIISEAFRPAHMAAITELAPPTLRARTLGLSRLGVNAGMSIGGVMGGLLAEVDYQLLFWVDGGTCLAAGIGIWLAFRGRNSVRRVPPRTNPPSSQPAKAASPWKDRGLLALLVIWVLLGCSFFQVFSTMPLYLNEHLHFTEAVVGLIFAVNTVLIVLAEMPLLHAMEKKPSFAPLIVGAVLLCGGNALLPLAVLTPLPPIFWVLVAVTVWTIGEMLAFPLGSAWVAGRACDLNRGRYMGALGMSFGVASVIGPVAGTYVYHHVGPHVLWLSVGGLAIVVGLSLYALWHFTEPAPATA